MIKIKVKIPAGAGVCLLSVFLLLISAILLTTSGASDCLPQVISVWLVGVGSVLIFIGLKGGIESNLQCIIIYAAYLVRVIYMLLDLYGRNYITLLPSADAEGFYKEAQTLYYGMPFVYSGTRYPYVINVIFHFFGDNRLCAQYINIILWVLSCFILERLCIRFSVRRKAKIGLFLLWGFLPIGIWLTSVLMRESMKMFFGLWSFERFIYFMECRRKRYLAEAFICALPAIILHSGSIALWAAYVLIIMLWNPKKQKYQLLLKSLIVPFIVLAAVIVIWISPLRFYLFAYFRNGHSLYAITHKPFSKGGSDYLRGMDYRSWWQFIPYTLLRMLYFLFSPLPTEARSLGDIAAFLMDGFPMLLVIMYMIWSMWRKKTVRKYIFVSLIGMIMFAGIFAWGVTNAGTAIRHRYMVWSVAIVGLLFSCCNEEFFRKKLKMNRDRWK